MPKDNGLHERGTHENGTHEKGTYQPTRAAYVPLDTDDDDNDDNDAGFLYTAVSPSNRDRCVSSSIGQKVSFTPNLLFNQPKKDKNQDNNNNNNNNNKRRRIDHWVGGLAHRSERAFGSTIFSLLREANILAKRFADSDLREQFQLLKELLNLRPWREGAADKSVSYIIHTANDKYKKEWSAKMLYSFHMQFLDDFVEEGIAKKEDVEALMADTSIWQGLDEYMVRYSEIIGKIDDMIGGIISRPKVSLEEVVDVFRKEIHQRNTAW
jgi:hypothetical protein